MKERIAVYCGTRNVYEYMVIAAKSLVIYSNVEKIYFLIEDDKFPYDIPSIIECINVKNQPYFHENGPNFNRKWTWMVLMRAALSKILPQHDVILSLDIDTICIEDVSSLWDVDLNGYYYAGVKEPGKSTSSRIYTNMGVTLFNLKMLRETHTDDKIIQLLNTTSYTFAEQDCLNKVCSPHILELPSMYNVCQWTNLKGEHRILHYACVAQWEKLPIIDKYRSYTWDEVRYNNNVSTH